MTEARSIGTLLADHISPTLIAASDATRTATTAQLVAEAAEWRVTPKLEAMLYDAASWDVIALAATTSNKHKSILIVGHQPTMSQTVYELTGDRLAVAPATGVVIDLNLGAWGDLITGRGSVRTTLSANVGA
jgi:phosphohistidine phosphatase